MNPPNWASRTGAASYALWGIVHIVGGGVQLLTLQSAGGEGLAAMISSAMPTAPAANPIPISATAYMGMGAFNILWIGLLVTVVAATLNWRNLRLGFWLNMALVGGADLALYLWLLRPGIMAWSDGMIGIGLFAAGLAFSLLGRIPPRSPELGVQEA